jgi:enoyl-CoA hydratase/carnithine racemase
MSTASNEPVLLRRDEGRVAILTLNRPHAMNALSGELIDALQAEFDRLAKDKEIRCVVIEATGRAFSTGHDLKEVTSTRDYAFHHDLLTRCSAMMMSIKRLPQPVIAKVHALATAAGCQLVAACDLAVASTTPPSPPRASTTACSAARPRWRSAATSAPSARSTCCSPASRSMPRRRCATAW